MDFNKRIIRVCIKVNGEFRRIFTLEARKDGDITFTPKYAEFRRKLGGASEYETSILNGHISIHRSNHSPVYNTIKFSREYSNGENKPEYQFTKALKSGSKLAPIYFYRSPSLDDDKYITNAKSNEELIELDSYNPKYYSLIYGIFVCNSTLHFESLKKGNFNFRSIYINGLHIVILWCFAPLPSINHASEINVISKSDDEIQKQFGHDTNLTTQGKTAKQCLLFMDHVAVSFINDHKISTLNQLKAHPLLFNKLVLDSKTLKPYFKRPPV